MQERVTIFVIVAIIAYLWWQNTYSNSIRLHLVQDKIGNEALVLSGRLAGTHRALFMIDTAYAGAPVMSTSYLAVQSRCNGGSVQSRYLRCIDMLRHEVSENDRHAAIHSLIAEGRCRAFTSGCTMRLMGIGVTSEAQADMLLCPSLKFDGGGGVTVGSVDADIMVTNPLHGSVHIITSDYLLHRAPCIIEPAKGRLTLRVPITQQLVLRPSFDFHEAFMVGGAFAVLMQVGGVTLRIVVDTGAAAALSVGRDSLEKIQTCHASGRTATQSGVNGERVCSDVLLAPVSIGAIDMGSVEVFANETNVEGADGHAGIGMLRALDMWFESSAIGFRRSSLPTRKSNATSIGSCNKELPLCASSPSKN